MGYTRIFLTAFFFQIDIFFFYSCVPLFVFVVVERERCRQKANCPQCQLILILKYEWSSRVLPLCTTNTEIVLTTLLYACTKKDKARNGLEKKKHKQ